MKKQISIESCNFEKLLKATSQNPNGVVISVNGESFWEFEEGDQKIEHKRDAMGNMQNYLFDAFNVH